MSIPLDCYIEAIVVWVELISYDTPHTYSYHDNASVVYLVSPSGSGMSISFSCSFIVLILLLADYTFTLDVEQLRIPLEK